MRVRSRQTPLVTAARSAPEVVVFDLDGVIRHWNDDELDDVEVAFGLPERTILNVAFSEDLGPACVTGTMSYREWMDEIRRRVLAEHGPGAAGALDEWEANVGRVDTTMLRVVRAVRAEAKVALLSNGSTRLRRDLHVLDLLDELDIIFNTAELGIAKPDPAVFELVLERLGVSAGEARFVDDLAENVAGAESVGIRAHVHTDPASTVAFLRAEGICLDGV
jgi:putative hydrolase of the HAD superfamily